MNMFKYTNNKITSFQRALIPSVQNRLLELLPSSQFVHLPPKFAKHKTILEDVDDALRKRGEDI